MKKVIKGFAWLSASGEYRFVYDDKEVPKPIPATLTIEEPETFESEAEKWFDEKYYGSYGEDAIRQCKDRIIQAMKQLAEKHGMPKR